jgi:phosphoglycerol transferase MdoB-like AlkP superfamily enzyme
MPKEKNKYALSVAFHDIPFRIFFYILIAKSVLFIYISYKGNITLFNFLLSFLPSLGVILVFLSISLFFKNIVPKFAYLFLLNFVLSFLYITHSLYFGYFNDFASFYHLNQINMLAPIVDAIISLIGKEIFFFVDFLFLPFLFLWFKKQKIPIITLGWVKGFSFFLLLGLLFNIPSLWLSTNVGNFFETVPERRRFVRLLGIVTYQAFDAYNYIRTKAEKRHVSQNDVEYVKDFFNKRGNATRNDFTGIGKGFNLIAIQVESLQNFVIGWRWNGNEVTPNLNMLAERGVYFNNIYDQTWAGNSSDATFLVNCSIFPSRKGAVSFLYTQNTLYCLPKILRDYGYTTSTMHGYRSSYWNRGIFEKSLGFEYQFYKDKYRMEDHLGWGLSDRAFFSQSADKIKNMSLPFYALLTTLSTHMPFDDVTSTIDNYPLGKFEGKLIGNYLRSMHYVDSAIGILLKELSENDLVSNSVIVVYGDHRTRLKESDLQMIGISDMDELQKIPLIISCTGCNQRDRISVIGGLIDATPTITNILGIDASSALFIGRDLVQSHAQLKDNGFVIFRDESFIGSISHDTAQEYLKVSDLILEKDLMPIIEPERDLPSRFPEHNANGLIQNRN